MAEGIYFKNGDTCEGYSYSFGDDVPMDFAEITVSGRYPAEGWARNRTSHELVKVVQGRGKLYFKDGVAQQLKEGDSKIHVPPGEWFAWESIGDTMKIEMICSPAFNQEQYETREQ